MMASHRIKIPLDVCYGSITLFLTILHNVFLLYHIDIFVSVYKIDKTSFWIGETIFLIWNSVNDPLFGWLSDRGNLIDKSGSPSGCDVDVVQRRLNALSFNGPLFALAFLCFWFPWGYAPLQFVVCLCLYDGFLTMVDLHHSALLADLAISAEVRTKLNWKSSFFSAFGSASVFLSYAVWNKESLHSFRIFCAILSLFSFLGFYFMSNLMKSMLSSSSTKFQFDKPQVLHNSKIDEYESSHEKPNFRRFIRQLMKQKNFVYFSVMNLIQVFHCHFNSNFFPLFLDNLVGSSIAPGFGSFLLGISFIAPHINNLYFLSLCRRFGVYHVINLLFLVKLVISIVMFMLGPGHIWMLCFFIASNRVFTEGTCKLLNLVISDLVDEDFVLQRRKKAVSALMFGTAALISKPGQTLAPLIGTWFLSMQTGYDIFSTGTGLSAPRVDTGILDPAVMEQRRQGCFSLLVYIPIICALIQLLVWTQFTLHGRRLGLVKSSRLNSDHDIL